MAQIVLEGVRKVYADGTVGVEGASFQVDDGERLVLVGPSGCGKSTLLRMIAGLEEISGGTLRIGERVVNQLPPGDRDIAMVFQSYALYPHMTVAENMGFALKLRGLPREQVAERVREAAELLELGELLERRPAQLSGGQRQRVALGRALVRQPQAFLLDEPLSNLDARLRGTMRAEIARLHRRTGTTMVYVTHDQVEAMTLGERIVVMERGRIQQIDTPMALYERPANVFVAGFLGSPPMNLLRGRLAGEGGWQLALADGQVLPLGDASIPVDWSGREIVLGIRPEHLHRAVGGHPGFKATVELVEPVGSEAFANLHFGEHALVARLPAGDLPEPGSQVELSVDAGRLHFFDAIGGSRL